MLYTPTCPVCKSTDISIISMIDEQIEETENYKKLIHTIKGACNNCNHEFLWDENYILDSVIMGS